MFVCTVRMYLYLLHVSKSVLAERFFFFLDLFIALHIEDAAACQTDFVQPFFNKTWKN